MAENTNNQPEDGQTETKTETTAGQTVAAGDVEEKKVVHTVRWLSKKNEPPKKVRIGMTVFNLPGAEEQRKGFETEDAERLVNTVKGYKILKAKG